MLSKINCVGLFLEPQISSIALSLNCVDLFLQSQVYSIALYLNCVGLFLEAQVYSSTLCLYPYANTSLDLYTFAVSFEIGKCESSNFALFRDCVSPSGLLVFPYNLGSVSQSFL